MLLRISGFILVSVLAVFAQDSFSYDPSVIDTSVVIHSNRNVYTLPERHSPLAQSFRLHLNNELLIPARDFEYRSSQNDILFFNRLQAGDTLHIYYKVVPVFLKHTYTFFSMDTVQVDSSSQDSIRAVGSVFKNPFAASTGRLTKSGSIVRGVTIGNNRDLTLNSGLNLQMSGYLTDDVEIVAALTDEATPIQPEGNTQTLREVDKVFIEFRSPWVKGTLGDFNLNQTAGEFATLSRKLQGVSISGKYSPIGLGATVATTRGFFNNLNFIGQEGNQGPYQLTGKNGEKQIIVLAGTERVWINGQKMVRGESNDYIIEYGNGQITFSNRRLITSESRIEVDFEYYPALQKYSRNVYAATSSGEIADGKLKLSASYYHEEDDPKKVLEAEGILSETEKNILKSAGDDPLQATVSGVTFVGDSLGFYVKKDSTIGNSSFVIYEYAGANLGDYNIVFSDVGSGNGDYRRDRLGVYRWVGIKKGNYLPVKLLPLPNKQQLADFLLQYAPSSNTRIEAEYAFSAFDQNTLSDVSDGDNPGQALRLNASGKKLNLGSAGELDVNATGRIITQNFRGADRILQPDFSRYWNILQGSESGNREQSLQINSNYRPAGFLTLSGNLGSLKKQALNSLRWSGILQWQQKYDIDAKLENEFISSKREQSSNDWLRQSATLAKSFGYFKPGFTLDREKRQNVSFGLKSGFEFLDSGIQLGLIKHRYLSGLAQFNRRNDYYFDPQQQGRRVDQAKTDTWRLRLDLAEWQNTSGHLEFVHRTKNFTPFFENTRIDSNLLSVVDPQVQDTVWQDRETNLAEIGLNHQSWKRALDVGWQYRISTEQLALREKVYLDVGEGRGNLRFDEDLQEYLPDADGNFILFIIPSGIFEPVTNIQTALRLNLDPARYWKRPQGSWQRFLSNFSSESYFRVDEETKEKDLVSLYLLNLSKYQRGSTLKGSIIYNQDLYLFKRDRSFNLRGRFRYRDDRFNQFLDANENEDKLSLERSLRASYRVVKGMKAQTEIRQRFTARNSKANRSRNRDIRAIALLQNFSWRPLSQWEFGFESENALERDVTAGRALALRYHQALLRGNYSIFKKGRVSAQYDYQNVVVTENPQNVVVPFEMARGRKEGSSQRWQLRGEYTVAENVVFTLFYSGRKDAGFERTIHTGQAEVRAFF